MARSKPERERGSVTAWLNRTLLPWIGPPPLGPYTDVPESAARAEKAQSVCPVCGALMSLHEVDRSGERTMIYHPAPEQERPRAADGAGGGNGGRANG